MKKHRQVLKSRTSTGLPGPAETHARSRLFNTLRGPLAAGLISIASVAQTAWLTLAQPYSAARTAIVQANGG